MEAREITIIETKNQRKSVIMSEAETLGELKRDLTAAGIDYTDMAFYEGVSKTELKSDDSPLPRDLQYKGQTTNKLVFMLTNANKKIKSGSMQRAAAYNKIKQYNLQEECIKRFSKNFTKCKTDDLVSLIFEVEKNKYNSVKSIKSEEASESTCDCRCKHTECDECTTDDSSKVLVYITKDVKEEIAVLKETIFRLCNALVDYDEFFSIDCNNIINCIKGHKCGEMPNKESVNSSYSDNDIEEMFSGMIE